MIIEPLIVSVDGRSVEIASDNYCPLGVATAIINTGDSVTILPPKNETEVREYYDSFKHQGVRLVSVFMNQADFDDFSMSGWGIETQELQCECGSHKTYGTRKNAVGHSSWCPWSS